MNKDFNIRLLYYRYKDTPYYAVFVISVVILVFLILLFQLVIPQVESWFSIRNEIIATRERIAIINQNVNFMNNMDKSQMENQVKIATNALPFEKDFGGILYALTDASTLAGVSLEDYSFQVGNIASISGQPSKQTKDLSSVKITVSLSGNVNGISAFLNEIYKKIPLSEVISVEGDSFSTTITLQFYQKQFPKIVFKDDQPFTAVSDKNAALLREFSSWQPVIDSEGPQEISSDSAVPLF